MSKRYLLLAKVGNTLRYYSFRTNAAPRTLGRSAWRIVEALYGKRLREILLIGDHTMWVHHRGRTSSKRQFGGLGLPLQERPV